MKFCKTCGKSTYKPKQRIYTKYCNLECRNEDKEYWKSISDTKKKQVISEEQKEKISISLKRFYKDNPKKKKDIEPFFRYSLDCKFKFNVYEYPEEFNLNLIEEFGWYKAKNRGNNLNGISRDHMVSVSYGFDNNIPTEHISHPANCELMFHNNNSSKGKTSSISYVELLKRIEEWNIKYGS